MTAYVIMDIEITDPKGYEDYIRLAPPTVVKNGGKYIARGGKAETLEGDWAPGRMVILEFASADQAKRWLDSSEYVEARSLRHKYANSKIIVVEGME